MARRSMMPPKSFPINWDEPQIGALGLQNGNYNSKCILNTYYMPNTFLSDLHVLTHLILTTGLLNGLGSVGFKTGNNFILS